MTEAGFTVERQFFFNKAGVLAWWLGNESSASARLRPGNSGCIIFSPPFFGSSTKSCRFPGYPRLSSLASSNRWQQRSPPKTNMESMDFGKTLVLPLLCAWPLCYLLIRRFVAVAEPTLTGASPGWVRRWPLEWS